MTRPAGQVTRPSGQVTRPARDLIGIRFRQATKDGKDSKDQKDEEFYEDTGCRQAPRVPALQRFRPIRGTGSPVRRSPRPAPIPHPGRPHRVPDGILWTAPTTARGQSRRAAPVISDLCPGKLVPEGHIESQSRRAAPVISDWWSISWDLFSSRKKSQSRRAAPVISDAVYRQVGGQRDAVAIPSCCSGHFRRSIPTSRWSTRCRRNPVVLLRSFPTQASQADTGNHGDVAIPSCCSGHFRRCGPHCQGKHASLRRNPVVLLRSFPTRKARPLRLPSLLSQSRRAAPVISDVVESYTLNDKNTVAIPSCCSGHFRPRGEILSERYVH
jgi:hypothetical protein